MSKEAGRPEVRYRDRIGDAGMTKIVGLCQLKLETVESPKRTVSGEASLKVLETKTSDIVKVFDERGQATRRDATGCRLKVAPSSACLMESRR